MKVTPQFERRVETLLAEFSPYKKSLTPTLLQLAAEEFGALGNEVFAWISSLIDVPQEEVHTIARYLDLLELQTRARYRVLVCTHTHCVAAGSRENLRQMELQLETKVGAKSSDGKYDLQEVQCLGCCEQAPAIQVNRDYFLRLTPDRIKDIFDKLMD